MNIRLRLLLFYFNKLTKGDNLSIPPASIRKHNRKVLEKMGNVIDYPPIQLFRVTNETIPMRDGATIPIRIYQPSDKQDVPLIVFYHGGGFVLRDLDSHDKVCRRMAKMNEAVVVSVGYRLAPEYKFPIPVQDCYDAFIWATQAAEQLGADASKITVAGDSAGGNLSTVVSILARDKEGPKIAAQVLVYPTTDARLNHPSIKEYGEGYFLTEELMNWFVDHYKGKEEDIYNPVMSPLLTENLDGLPPAFVCTAELDPLKDEAIAYVKRLEEAGNEVFYKDYKQVIHGFFNMARITKKAIVCQEDISVWLKAIWARS